MRWIQYLGTSAEAYADFERYVDTLKTQLKSDLEDPRKDFSELRFLQGNIAALIRIQIALEDYKKESRAYDYGTEQTRAGPD